MNRCVFVRWSAVRRTCPASLGAGLALCLAGLLPLAAQAQRAPDHRVFPAQALRGELLFSSATEVLLNGQAQRLAPGARIRGENNQLLMTAALSGSRLVVHYTKEPQSGLLMDIWVLRAVERNNRPWPATELEARAWTFEPAAQTWAKP
jgi:hypothetical protein